MGKLVLLLALGSLSGVAMAGMMGNGGGMGGGMMGAPNVAESPPPTDLDATARKGYESTRTYCSACHATPSPEKHTAAEWPAVIDRMEGYMRKQGKSVPDAHARDSILDYLAKTGSH